MTIYAYYRVSTDAQDFQNQKFGVLQYCQRLGLTIDKEFVDDGVSGSVKAKERKLWKVVKEAHKGDFLIVSELSRIGRSTADVLETVQILCNKEVAVHLVKQSMVLDQSPMGKMMIAIMAAFAEMERDLTIQRTKEALARKKLEGVKLGRPKGFTYRKLKKEDVLDLVSKGFNKTQAARLLECDRQTLHRFCRENNIEVENKKGSKKHNA